MSFLSGIFGKKNKLPADFSALGVDMHSHLIHAIDDGSKSVEESLELISILKNYGYKKLITTPHIMGDMYRNTPEIILPKLEILKKAVSEKGWEIQLDVAAEYYLDFEFIQKIKDGNLLSFGDNYLLFETSYINLPDNFNEAVFLLITSGYKPVLAHPERYPFWYDNFEALEKLKESGILFQVNLNSLAGYYSPQAKRVAEKLIDAGMIDFAGSDLHGARHLEALGSVSNLKYYEKLISSGKLRNNTL